MKSARDPDSTLSLGDSDSHAAPVLDHIAEKVVTAAKGVVTDPEQAFTQGKYMS